MSKAYISLNDAIVLSGGSVHRETLTRWIRSGKLRTECGQDGNALIKTTSLRYRVYPECPVCRERFCRNDLKRVYCSRECSQRGRRKKQKANAFSKRLLKEYLRSSRG